MYYAASERMHASVGSNRRSANGPTMKRYVWILAVLLLAVATSACSSHNLGSTASSTATIIAASAATAPAKTAQSTNAAAIANGRAIFLRGIDASGARIVAKPPAQRPSCAACHMPTGAGGVHFPDGAVSADLRHAALVTRQKPPYTIALLERAVSAGIDNDGDKLDPAMPRWALSQRNLHDVVYYVLTQLK